MSVALMATSNGELVATSSMAVVPPALKEGMNGMAGSHSLEGAGVGGEKNALFGLKAGGIGEEGGLEGKAGVASRPAQAVDGDRQGGGRVEVTNGGEGTIVNGADSSGGLATIGSESSSAGVVSVTETEGGERVQGHGRSEGERGEEQAIQVAGDGGHNTEGIVGGSALEQSGVAGVAEAPAPGSETHTVTGGVEAVKVGEGEGEPGGEVDDGQRRVRWRDHATGALTNVHEFEPSERSDDDAHSDYSDPSTGCSCIIL